ncbi:MAG: hypothetical protein HY329_12635 [Chloroflexi bacterium]|nr:hypothetical protein [Chloroflexota bacterium]
MRIRGATGLLVAALVAVATTLMPFAVQARTVDPDAGVRTRPMSSEMGEPGNAVDSVAAGPVAQLPPSNAFVPVVRNGAADPTFGGTWRTGIQVMNLEPQVTVSVRVFFLRGDGAQIAVAGPVRIAPFRSHTFFGAGLGVEEGFSGAAVVLAENGFVKVIVNQLVEDRGMAASYNGISETRRQVFLPSVELAEATVAAGAQSSIHIQNAGTQPLQQLNLTLSGTTATGDAVATTIDLGAGLQPGASYELTPRRLSELTRLSSFSGSAVVTTEQAVAVVTNHGTGQWLVSSPGSVQGSGFLNAPLVQHLNSGFESVLFFQNVGSAETTATLRIFSSLTGAQVAEVTRTLAPGARVRFASGELIRTTGFVGSATVQAGPGGSVAGIVRQINPVSGQASDYVMLGREFASAPLIAPLVQTANSGWSSGIQVQNVGDTEAIVTLRVTDPNGIDVTTSDSVRSILPGRSETFFPVSDPGRPMVGSAIISGPPTGARLIGIVNQLNTGTGPVDFFTTYELVDTARG